MKNWVDREIQLKILNFLLPLYPHQTYSSQVALTLLKDYDIPLSDEEALVTELADRESYIPNEFYSKIEKNLFYLSQTGLIGVKAQSVSGSQTTYLCVITNIGIDFLSEDGGLSAILGVVTVRLHADTVKDLLQAKVLSEPSLSDADKKMWSDKIKSLSDKALEHVTLRGLDVALSHAPQGLSWLGKLIGF